MAIENPLSNYKLGRFMRYHFPLKQFAFVLVNCEVVYSKPILTCSVPQSMAATPG